MSLPKIMTLMIIALNLSACSTIRTITKYDAIKARHEYNEKLTSEFEFSEGKAIRIDKSFIGKKIRIITPPNTELRDRFILGEQDFTRIGNADTKTTVTNTIKTVTDDKGSGFFSYTKSSCPKRVNDIFFSEATGYYYNEKTRCMTKNGKTIPSGGYIVTYEGEYKVNSINKGKEELHEITITKAESAHETFRALLGTEIHGFYDIASKPNFLSIMRLYEDEELTFKFYSHTPKELEAAMYRKLRKVVKKEYDYASQVNRTNKNFFSGFNFDDFFVGRTLKDSSNIDGIITLTFNTAFYKNNGSLLTLSPNYYPSAKEVEEDDQGVTTINFVKKRAHILNMVEAIKNE